MYKVEESLVSFLLKVELLVMKALSVGLLRGSIDEVDKRVHITWVQPRVLDLQQVICLRICFHMMPKIYIHYYLFGLLVDTLQEMNILHSDCRWTKLGCLLSFSGCLIH